MRPDRVFRLLGCVGLAVVLMGADGKSDARLSQAQELIDAGDPAEAIELLGKVLKRQPDAAEALLLRSTAHLMESDWKRAREDLRRAVEAEPGLRQGWLNLAAVDLERRAADVQVHRRPGNTRLRQTAGRIGECRQQPL